jgi:glutaredoxin
MGASQTSIVVYGASWCPDAQRARQFFDERNLSYDWHDIDEEPDAKSFVLMTNQGKIIVPTILFPDGSILVEPTNDELAEKLAAGD